MRKIFNTCLHVLFIVVSASALAQTPANPLLYCSGVTPNPSQPADEKIGRVQILNTPLNNSSSNCVGYSNFTNLITQLIPGQTYTIIVNGYDCDGGFNYAAGISVFIDYNNDKVFQTAERVVASAGTNTFPNSPGQDFTFTFALPIAGVAYGSSVLMRVSAYESYAGTTHNGCTAMNSFYGEVEDYTVFLGEKKYDYNAKAILSPKSNQYAICGTNPFPVKLLVENTGNQPLTGGQLTCNVKGPLTNQSFTSYFYSTILPGEVDSFVIGNIVATADEDVTIEAIVKSNIMPSSTRYYDTIPRNDTSKRFIHIYQNPTYTLSSNNTCILDSTQVTISNFSFPSSVVWSNDSKFTTTNLYATTTSKLPLTVIRGVCKF
jgi:hypothetical protein